MKENRVVQALIFISVLLLLTGTGIPAGAQDVIKIGGTNDISGRFAFVGIEIETATQDAIALANKEGGFGGKRLEYYSEDSKYDLKVGVDMFKKIMSEHQPVAFLMDATHTSKALAPEIGGRYKTIMGTVSMASQFAEQGMYRGVFIPGPTYGDQLDILLRYVARQKRGAKVAFFYSDTAFGTTPIPYARLKARKLRLNLVGEIAVSIRKPDISEEINKLAEWNPDYVLIHGLVVSPIPQLIQGCRDKGMKCKFLSSLFATTKRVLDKLGPLAEGYMGVNPYAYWWMDDVPMIKKMKDYAAKQYPEVKYRSNLYMLGFTRALIVIESIRKAQAAESLNYDGLVKALHSIKNLDTGGLTGPLTNRNNRFPVATVWNADPKEAVFKPVADWRDFHLE
jgi:branched-chain amino acid transport system substrate-binding protein